MILNNFTDDEGLLHCYRKGSEETFSSTVGKAFVKKHLYAKHDAEGRRNDVSKEHELARSVESPAGPVVQKILRNARRKQEPRLTEPEKEAWDLFFCVQMRRTLASREAIDGEKLVKWARRVTTETMGPFSEADEDRFMAEMGTPERRRSAVHDAWIDGLLERRDPLYWALREKGLLVVVVGVKDGGFVIGDDPIVPLIPPGRTLEDENASNLFPIAPDVLVACYGPPGSEDLVIWPEGPDTGKLIDTMNLEILANSLMVASSSKTNLERLLNKERAPNSSGSY